MIFPFRGGSRCPETSFLQAQRSKENPFTKDSCKIYVQRKENLPNLALKKYKT